MVTIVGCDPFKYHPSPRSNATAGGKMRGFSFRDEMELDFRSLRPGAPGEQLEAMVRELGQMLGLEAEWSGRGADEGRDLIFMEHLKGSLSVERIRWLVQCKDHAIGGKSVREKDVGAIMDRIHQHRANGFLLATTTTPSTGLKKLLDALDSRNGGPTRTWVWDAAELRRLLRMDEARGIAGAYFPNENWDVIRLTHGLVTSLAALQHNNSLLQRLLDRPSDQDWSETQRRLLESSAALIDDLQFQVEGTGLRASLHHGVEFFSLNAEFFSHVMWRAQHFALVHSSPPIEFALRLSPPSDSRRLCGSPRLLERVILEIISNAIRYRKPGERPSIRLDQHDEPERTSILIEDRGIGIDPAEIGHIFQQGYRGPAAQRLSLRGSGLGLSTARSLMREFGGDVQFEATPGSTRFRIILQRAKG